RVETSVGGPTWMVRYVRAASSVSVARNGTIVPVRLDESTAELTMSYVPAGRAVPRWAWTFSRSPESGVLVTNEAPAMAAPAPMEMVETSAPAGAARASINKPADVVAIR